MPEAADLYDEPDLKLAGLSLWVEARERPGDDDFWDGNWLIVRASVEAPGSWVELSGPWLRADAISTFLAQVEVLSRDLQGKATLASDEPMIKAVIEVGARGAATIFVEATPDHVSQQHSFHFESDQTYLPQIIASCRKILTRFPVRGAPT